MRLTASVRLVATLLVAGQAVTQSDLAKRLDNTEARVAELIIQHNRASQTTQTAQKLGAVEFAVLCHHECWMCMRAPARFPHDALPCMA